MTLSPFDPIAWLQANLEWDRTDSAAFIYERMASQSGRPRSVDAVDAMLSPLVKIVCEMPAPPIARPGEWAPWITAISPRR